MFNNNINAIIAGFNILNKEEEKLNYYYEPLLVKKKKDWKRCYVINELKKDFQNDIGNFGFSPFIGWSFNDQRDNKNITKHFHFNNYDFAQYIKKMNMVIHDTQILNKDNKYKIKEKLEKRFELQKDKPYKLNKKINNLSCINIFRRNASTKNKTRKINHLTKIVKFNREEMMDISKLRQIQLINNNNDLESSFNYGVENINESFNENIIAANPDNKYPKLKMKDNTFNKSHIFKIINDSDISTKKKSINKRNNKKYNTTNKIKINKIKIKNVKFNTTIQPKKMENTFFNFNALNSSSNSYFIKLNSGKSTKNSNLNLNRIKKRNANNSLFLERLENYPGGIFKTAKKFIYPAKLKKKKFKSV